jgi:hypothetical protein
MRIAVSMESPLDGGRHLLSSLCDRFNAATLRPSVSCVTVFEQSESNTSPVNGHARTLDPRLSCGA